MRRTLLRKATRQTVAVAFLVSPFILAQGLLEQRLWAYFATGILWTIGVYAVVKTARETLQVHP